MVSAREGVVWQERDETMAEALARMSKSKAEVVAPYHDRFDEVLQQMSALHSRKGADYGGVNDPYANVRASAEFGVDPWCGALIRLNDKITRLKAFIRNGNLKNESALDSIRDIAVYGVIMQILYEEQYGVGQ